MTIVYRDAVRLLQPVITPIFDALQEGLKQAAQDHAHHEFKRTDDPHYYLHVVRRVAIKALQAEGLQAIDDTSDKPLLPMSSIMIAYRDLAIKVLHTRKDNAGRPIVPLPGRSADRQKFWRQEAGSALPGLRTDNLLALWLDDMGELVDPMRLVRPLGGDHRRYSLRLDWEANLSRSMASLRAADLDELVPAVKHQQLGDEDTG